jgi:hypothetical protein
MLQTQKFLIQDLKRISKTVNAMAIVIVFAKVIAATRVLATGAQDNFILCLN